MGRVILTIVVPLLLPTALYAVWRSALGRGVTVPSWWAWLVIAGLSLACLVLIVLTVDFGGPREGTYVPPHVSDGTVVPGHVEPGHAAPAPPP